MQRPERIVVLGLGMAFSPLVEALLVPGEAHPFQRLTVACVLLLAVTTQITAMQRLVYVVRELSGVHRVPHERTASPRLIRSAVAGFIASVSDFLVFLLFSRVLGTSAPAATLIGCFVGGVINFTINRVWAFEAEGSVASQAPRYVFVSASSAVLNAGGVSLLLSFPLLDTRVAWFLCRALVFVTWNFPLFRDYVFAPAPRSEGELSRRVPAE
jgi:putative flippase GtrA